MKVTIPMIAKFVDTSKGTYAAHGADLASTGVGLAMGAAEANPLGVIGIPFKIAITEHIKTLLRLVIQMRGD